MAGSDLELRQVHAWNRWANEHIEYAPDPADDWADVATTLRTGRGDCEDIALLKWAKLREAGIPDARLLLAWGHNGARAHMVVLYQPPEGETLVLDNLMPVRPLSARADLAIWLRFDSQHAWAAGQQVPAARVGKWRAWLARNKPAGAQSSSTSPGLNPSTSSPGYPLGLATTRVPNKV